MEVREEKSDSDSVTLFSVYFTYLIRLVIKKKIKKGRKIDKKEKVWIRFSLSNSTSSADTLLVKFGLLTEPIIIVLLNDIYSVC